MRSSAQVDMIPESIHDKGQDGIIAIDHDGIIQSFNSAATKIFGYDQAEVTGKDISLIIPDAYIAECNGHIANFIAIGEKPAIGNVSEIKGKKKNGSIIPIEINANEVWVAGQRMLVAMVRNTRERNEAEAAIHQYVEKLKRSNQELDDFAYIASHDLKEPIRGLTNNAMFLLEDYNDVLDANGKKRLNRMVYLCKRMEQLVEDLLYFSRLGSQDLAVQPADLNFIIRDIALMMETIFQEKNVEIFIPRPLPIIVCDVPRVTEVFRNLISNAVKYNKNVRKIVEIGVTLESSADAPVFYVKDNGIGIEPHFYSDIFRIFRRLNEEDENTKGSGVGLTFVKKIIERHGGTIWLESAIGKGTTFFFTIKQPDRDGFMRKALHVETKGGLKHG